MERFFFDLKEKLKHIGIRKGDIIYIASDGTLLINEARKKYGIKNLEERNTFLWKFIDTLQDIVGNDGTLLFPVFTWKFCKGEIFDIRKTKGEVGILSNWILDNRKDFVRTKHPIYSFMVWGKDAKYLQNLNNIDAWGKDDSPFAYLHRKHAKMMLLNVSLQRGFTFMHYVERCLNVPYRYNKLFIGKYVDENGIESIRKYSMYVRDLNITSQEYLPDEFLEKFGIVSSCSVNEQKIKVFDLAESYDIVKNDYLNNAGNMCYKFKNYELEWNKGATHDDEICNRIS